MNEDDTTFLTAVGGDAAAIIESTKELAIAAQRVAPIEGLDGYYTAIVPAGNNLIEIDLERLAPRPRAKRGYPMFDTTESLATYLGIHKTEGTTLYANADDLLVEAVIDDHEPDLPGHGAHRATLQLQRTEGCERWLGAHAQYLSQEEFSQLIEDGLTEIASPDGATLLEVAQSIRATKSATFRSDKRLTTGRVQFQWVEELAASAGSNGDLEIPETVTLVFEPFYGAAPVQIDARFRYRINGGKLSMGFWLIRHVDAMRASFRSECARLGELTGGLEVLSGRSRR